MPYCSIDEAFPDTAVNSGVVARKEERKRARKCGGPALSFLKGIDIEENSFEGFESVDPDRQTQRPTPPPESMKGSEGFNSNSQKDTNTLMNSKVDYVIGQNKSSKQTNLPKATIPQLSEKKVTSDSTIPSYFGKSLSDIENYADFSSSLSDNTGYHADFLGSFGAVGLEKSAGKATLTTPSVNDAWKPLTPSGARSSFFELLPSPGGEQIASSYSSFSKDEKESLLKKIDTLFAKLEDLEAQKNEYAHAEITIFVLSGLFLLYGIESLKKIGR